MKCRHPGSGVYSPIWTKDEGTEVCPSEWGKKGKPALLAIQYANHIQCSFIFNKYCNHCKNKSVRDHERGNAKIKKQLANFNAKCLEEGEWHLQKCANCNQSRGKNECGYRTEQHLTCKTCITGSGQYITENFKRIDKASDVGSKVCILCLEEKMTHEFQMVCVCRLTTTTMLLHAGWSNILTALIVVSNENIFQ